MKNIAVFASGNGTNAENIIKYFNRGEGKRDAHVVLVVCNRPEAGVIGRAERLGVPVRVLSAKETKSQETMSAVLQEFDIDLIVLAGYLLLVPTWLVQAYPNKIINIHPALLPKYGGKGMYGEKVHQAVVAAGEKQTGITIHYVNECYDEGKTIFQATVDLLPEDTVLDVERKIHQLEQQHFPRIIHNILI